MIAAAVSRKRGSDAIPHFYASHQELDGVSIEGWVVRPAHEDGSHGPLWPDDTDARLRGNRAYLVLQISDADSGGGAVLRSYVSQDGAQREDPSELLGTMVLNGNKQVVGQRASMAEQQGLGIMGRASPQEWEAGSAAARGRGAVNVELVLLNNALPTTGCFVELEVHSLEFMSRNPEPTELPTDCSSEYFLNVSSSGHNARFVPKGYTSPTPPSGGAGGASGGGGDGEGEGGNGGMGGSAGGGTGSRQGVGAKKSGGCCSSAANDVSDPPQEGTSLTAESPRFNQENPMESVGRGNGVAHPGVERVASLPPMMDVELNDTYEFPLYEHQLALGQRCWSLMADVHTLVRELEPDLYMLNATNANDATNASSKTGADGMVGAELSAAMTPDIIITAASTSPAANNVELSLASCRIVLDPNLDMDGTQTVRQLPLMMSSASDHTEAKTDEDGVLVAHEAPLNEQTCELYLNATLTLKRSSALNALWPCSFVAANGDHFSTSVHIRPAGLVFKQEPESESDAAFPFDSIRHMVAIGLSTVQLIIEVNDEAGVMGKLPNSPPTRRVARTAKQGAFDQRQYLRSGGFLVVSVTPCASQAWLSVLAQKVKFHKLAKETRDSLMHWKSFKEAAVSACVRKP